MATLAAAHFVDCDITETSSGTGSWTSTVPNAQSRTTSHPQTRLHLEGEIVQILDDGAVVDDQTIASGVVSGIAGTYHIGLAYTSTVKPSKLDLEGMGLIVTKLLTKAIVSFYDTLMGKVGTSSTKMETISFSTALFTGEKEVPLDSRYEREGDIIILQDEPLPCICRGIVLDLGGHLK